MDRYLQPHQARQRAPTVFEDLLGDALERAFAAGATTVETVIEHLNRTGPANENAQVWTKESFEATMARLGGQE
jgi:hypothetical protein